MNIAGLILAAGESRRMGRDKALLEIDGSTFLQHLVSLFLPRVKPVIAVLGHHADEIRESLPFGREADRGAFQVAVNENYRQGMLTSLQTGIRALPAETEAAIFTLVDLPAVCGETLDRLLEAFRLEGKPLAIPRCEGRRGHPVVASRPILDEFVGLPGDASPKDVIRAHREQTEFVDVDDPGVVRDIDLPSEYESLRRSRSFRPS